MTFKIAVDNAKTLLDIFTVINVVVDEATLQLDSEGIKFCHMDPNRVAFINSETPKSAFTEYQCTEPTKIGVNLIELIKTLKRGGASKTTLEFNAGKKLKLQFGSPYERDFTLPILTAAIDTPLMPQTSYNVKASLATGTLNQAVEDAQLVGDYFIINATAESLKFSVDGDLMQNVGTMTKTGDILLSLDVKEPCQAKYSLNYISAIIKTAAAISDTVNLEYSTNQPIKLDFHTQGKTEFWLAPRIETEE